MYLAEFNGEAVQGLIRITRPRVTTDAWWRTLTRLTREAWSTPDVAAAVRYVVTPRSALDHLIVLAAPRRAERELRQLIGAFTRLEIIAPGSVELPLDADRFDALMGTFPAVRCHVDEPYGVGDTWFACDFRVGSLLDDLVSNALLRGHRIGYQANVRPLLVSSNQLRMVRRNALRVHELDGASAELRDMQDRLADELDSAVAVVDEFLAADSHEGARWLAQWLHRVFAQRYRSLRFDEPAFRFANDAFDNELTTPLVGGDTTDDSYVCSHAVDDRELALTLVARIDDGVVSDLVTAASPNEHELFAAEVALQLPDSVASPPRSVGAGSIFVSYKRDDLARIAPVIQQLHSRGWHVWYDREIPGGLEWAELIETRVRDAFVVLLFLSRNALKSRFVRKEAVFADACGKAIVPVLLEELNLTGGLDLLLSAVQRVDATDREFDTRLDAALRTAAKAAGVSPPH